MKRVVFVASCFLTLISTTGCGLFVQNPKTYKVNIAPKLDLSASRRTIDTNVKVVIDSKIADPFKLARGNNLVLIEVNNFRKSIETAISQSLSPQFAKVEVSANEKKQGLEVVILGANYPEPVDVLAFHFALLKDGKLIYEYKGKTKPITKMVQMNRATWQDETSKLTLEFLEKNINQMAEAVRDQLIINEKLNDFWAEYEKKQGEAQKDSE